MQDNARMLSEVTGVDVAAARRERTLARLAGAADEGTRLAHAEEYDEVRVQFPDREIHLEDGCIPYVRVRDEGGGELRFFPPAALEIHDEASGYCGSWSFHDDLGVPIERLGSIAIEDLQACLRRWRLCGHP